MADQMDLLREQAKMLAGEVGFCTSSLKRMSEQASINPDDVQFQVYTLFLRALRIHLIAYSLLCEFF